MAVPPTLWAGSQALQRSCPQGRWLGVTDHANEAVVGHLDRSCGSAGGELPQCRPDVGRSEFLELRAPNERGQWGQDLPIRRDRLGRSSFETVGQKVIDSVLD